MLVALSSGPTYGGVGGGGGEGCGGGVFGWRMEELGDEMNSLTSHTSLLFLSMTFSYCFQPR